MSASDIRILMLGERHDPAEELHATLSRAGYEVHAASCEAEGLTELLLWNPDLILLDLWKPAPHGAAFCKHLRMISTAQIIAFSANKDRNILVDTLDAGADDFVWKPFSVTAVHARIRACLRRRPQQLRVIQLR